MRYQSQQSALVLLELMVKYKPYLKPYAYRLHSWGLVLREYNEVMGTSYRQVRTIKNKFERLKCLYKHEPECTHFKGYSEAQIRQLEKLISDSDALSTPGELKRMDKRKRLGKPDGGAGDASVEAHAIAGAGAGAGIISDEGEGDSLQHLEVSPGEGIRQGKPSLEDGSENVLVNRTATPPPLDTIVMGMPKNTLPAAVKSPPMKLSGLDIDYLVNEVVPSQPFSDETNTLGSSVKQNVTMNDNPKVNALAEVRSLAMKLTTEQAREDQEMAYKQQQLEGKFMTQADFFNYKKENRAVQLRILNLLSDLLEG